MPGWDSGVDLVTCSFFFWTLGTSLQKNYVGFLRSLLYQIAEQREDLIPIMAGQNVMPGGTSYSHEAVRVHAWTKERLDDALKRFLSNKPSSIRVCFFIDGLDEFVGDEDLLLETLRLLSGTSRTHVCVSSRPEQIFRQGFAQSPRLRLQDLNHRDIEKTTKDRLGATLAGKFPHLPIVVDQFVEDVISRSEGIFLWTELIMKDLQIGARNSDNLQELRERFDLMPDTIEGLYRHMLGRLEGRYRQEAARYFQLLVACADLEDLGILKSSPITLLHCACAEGNAWSKVLSHDFVYFQCSEFHDSCRDLETRILTRCAGLIEISEPRESISEWIRIETVEGGYDTVPNSQEASSVACFLREIRFIHKTVIEFLQRHEQFFLDPDWRLTAAHTAARGRLGITGLTPIIICTNDARPGSFKMDKFPLADLLATISWTEALWPSRLGRHVARDVATQLVNKAYEILRYVNESLNGSSNTLYEFLIHPANKPSWSRPFYDCIGFAAFIGQNEYVTEYMAQTNRTSQDVEYLLLCTFLGFYFLTKDFSPYSSTYARSAHPVQGYCKIVTDLLKYSRDLDVYMKTAASAVGTSWNSKWVSFLDCSLDAMNDLAKLDPKIDARIRQQVRHSIVLWKDATACFLEYDVDVNTSLPSYLSTRWSDERSSMGVEFIVSETLLAWSERTFAHSDPEVRKEVEDTVRSYGGQRRRTIHSLEIGKDIYCMTQEQSDRLLHALAGEDQSLSSREVITGSWLEREKGKWKELSLIPSESPDPTTERKLKVLLDYIDGVRLAHGRFGYAKLDFGDE